MTPPLDLAAARAVCDAAPEDIEMETAGRAYVTYERPTVESKAFYAHARSLLPAALSEIETLRAALAEACGALHDIGSHDDEYGYAVDEAAKWRALLPAKETP